MDKRKVIDCYDKTAAEYAAKFGDELNHKPADIALLKSFADANAAKGRMIDFGCGPGQTTQLLVEHGITDIIGTDISPKMIEVARQLYPAIQFETADMLQPAYPDQSFGSAIAFYSIVHFDNEQLRTALSGINRVLKTGGEFLFSFHIGTDVVHLDNFLEQTVDIDFRFFTMDIIRQLLAETNFEILDIIEREAYPEVEYPSRRGYVWVRKS